MGIRWTIPDVGWESVVKRGADGLEEVVVGPKAAGGLTRLSRRSVKGSAGRLVKEMIQRRLTINNAPRAVKSTSIPVDQTNRHTCGCTTNRQRFANADLHGRTTGLP